MLKAGPKQSYSALNQELVQHEQLTTFSQDMDSNHDLNRMSAKLWHLLTLRSCDRQCKECSLFWTVCFTLPGKVRLRCSQNFGHRLAASRADGGIIVPF